MAKWGIKSERELEDIMAIIRAIMMSQFLRLRPKWSREFGEDVLRAVEEQEQKPGSKQTEKA